MLVEKLSNGGDFIQQAILDLIANLALSKSSTEAAIEKGVGKHLVALIQQKVHTVQQNMMLVNKNEKELLCAALKCLASFALHETSSGRLLVDDPSTMVCLVEIIECFINAEASNGVTENGSEIFNETKTSQKKQDSVLECATSTVRTFARHKGNRQKIASSGVVEQGLLSINRNHRSTICSLR